MALPPASITSELQQVSPSAIIELFRLETNIAMHGGDSIYPFHNGTNLNGNTDIYWQGVQYFKMPIEATGFEYKGEGSLPRPRLKVSNIFGNITAILLTLPNGLEGAKVTRVRTLARYIDDANFPGGVSPYTPDPTAEFPSEIFYIDRKVLETRDVVEFELAAAFDLANVRIPKRQCIANICQWKYRSAECTYNPYLNPALSTHYVRNGYYEGRNINAAGQFDPGYYLAVYADVLAAGYTLATAHLHYLSSGIYEGRNGNAGGLWSAVYYLDTYVDLGVLVYFNDNDQPTTVPSQDSCGKRLDSCRIRFGANNELPYGSFPGIGTFYA